MGGNGKLNQKAIARLKRAIALFCLIAAGLYYLLVGREQERASLQYIESTKTAGVQTAETWTAEKRIPAAQITDAGMAGTQAAGAGTVETQMSGTQAAGAEILSSGTGIRGNAWESNANDNVSAESAYNSTNAAQVQDGASPQEHLGAVTIGAAGMDVQTQSAEPLTHDDGLIDLNSATAEELDTLPGIGPATAKLIVEYRETYGGFAAIEEVKNVKRIGDKTFEKFRHLITVR